MEARVAAVAHVITDVEHGIGIDFSSSSHDDSARANDKEGVASPCMQLTFVGSLAYDNAHQRRNKDAPTIISAEIILAAFVSYTGNTIYTAFLTKHMMYPPKTVEAEPRANHRREYAAACATACEVADTVVVLPQQRSGIIHDPTEERYCGSLLGNLETETCVNDAFSISI